MCTECVSVCMWLSHRPSSLGRQSREPSVTRNRQTPTARGSESTLKVIQMSSSVSFPSNLTCGAEGRGEVPCLDFFSSHCNPNDQTQSVPQSAESCPHRTAGSPSINHNHLSLLWPSRVSILPPSRYIGCDGCPYGYRLL